MACVAESITRCAILILPPATFSLHLPSRTTGPLWMPMRSRRCGRSRNARAISTAHCAGAMGSRANTSAIPSPRSRRINSLRCSARTYSGVELHDGQQFASKAGLLLDGDAASSRPDP